MVALEVFAPEGKRGGSVRFVFWDDPIDLPHQRWMGVRKWKTYPEVW